MADVGGITAIRPTDNTVETRITYGATVAAGNVVYQDAADNEYKLADNDAEATAVVAGIAITPGVDAGEGYIATAGNIILVGATLTKGVIYVLSSTAGGIAPSTDLASGDYVSILGVAESTTQLNLSITSTNIDKP